MKILFITRWYPDKYDPQLGVFVQKHAQAVSHHCDTAVLYITQDPGLTRQFILEEKKSGGLSEFILYFKPFHSGFNLLDRVVNLLYYFLYAHLATKVISKKWGKQDITHAVIFSRTVLASYIQKMRTKAPVVVSEHASGYATGRFAGKSALEKSIVRFLARKAGAVTVVSGFLRDKMIDAGIHAKYVVIPNIVEPVLLENVSSPEPNSIRIAVVADMVDEIKNISGIIRAFCLVEKKYPHAHLHLLGDGIDKTQLESLADKSGLLNTKIFFHGRKDNQAVYEFLSGSSFLVMNSRVETFSLVCAEALGCGKPVIATRCGGPEDFLSDATGILINPDDDKQLGDAMSKMITEYRSYDPIVLQEIVRSRFSAGTVGKEFLKVYEDLLK